MKSGWVSWRVGTSVIVVSRVNGDVTKCTVHKREMARLVEMVVAAAPGIKSFGKTS
jgi:hypothetical protein